MDSLLIAVIIAAVVMLTTAVIAFRMLFRNFDHFVECNRYANQPAWISWWRGEHRKDGHGTERLAIWWGLILLHGLVALVLAWFAASVIKHHASGNGDTLRTTHGKAQGTGNPAN